jgi:hypothetical protein
MSNDTGRYDQISDDNGRAPDVNPLTCSKIVYNCNSRARADVGTNDDDGSVLAPVIAFVDGFVIDLVTVSGADGAGGASGAAGAVGAGGAGAGEGVSLVAASGAS